MKHLIMILFTAVIALSFGCAVDDGIKVISVTEFSEAVNNDSAAVILDVRTAEEFAEGHIEGAINLNVKDAETFENGMKALDKSKNYYVYCRSGRRSHNAAAKMQNAGFKVVDMDGGIIAWKDANMPVKVSLSANK